MKSDKAVEQLLNINRETFNHFAEQQQIEDERLLELTSRDDTLRRNDILNAMQATIEKEAANFKRYDHDREETTRSVLIEYAFLFLSDYKKKYAKALIKVFN